MKGVEYFFDDRGRPKAVLIDLKKNRELWEELQDIAIANRRRGEPTVSWEKVKKELQLPEKPA